MDNVDRGEYGLYLQLSIESGDYTHADPLPSVRFQDGEHRLKALGTSSFSLGMSIDFCSEENLTYRTAQQQRAQYNRDVVTHRYSMENVHVAFET